MTSLNSSINSNSEYSTICFCSLKAIEKKNCGECSYMLSKEVKQLNINLYQNQKQLSIKLQQQQNFNEEQKKKSEHLYNFSVNKREYRKSVEICFCQCPAREIHCDNCSYGIPQEDDNYNDNDFSDDDGDDKDDYNDNDRNNEQDDFNDFINECTAELSKNQIESFVL
ncbi:hypothetical protein ACTA71_006699 [Dictyostelium dimigraforme]